MSIIKSYFFQEPLSSYKKEYFEKTFPEYYKIMEEELYECRDGYVFIWFREDLEALSAHQIALEHKPKAFK